MEHLQIQHKFSRYLSDSKLVACYSYRIQNVKQSTKSEKGFKCKTFFIILVSV